jgi:hypothetical protein
MRQAVRLKLKRVVHVKKDKFQNPSSNIQRNPKLQLSTSCPNLELGDWNFSGTSVLELGASA